MDSRLFFAFVFAVVASAAAQHDHNNHEEHRVDVAVYYESLCPDSKKFVNQQLYPSLQGKLSNFVNLTLIPYGKTTRKFEANEYKFMCDHGPGECVGNKIQACALKLIDNGQKTQGLGYNKVSTGFINCLMDRAVRNGDEATFPTKDCAALNTVTKLNEIEKCANQIDGSNYLANLGKLTDEFQNPLKSVPTIVFNKQYKEQDSILAKENFVKALCQYIQHDKPAECNKNGVDSINFSFVLLSVAMLFSQYLF